MPKKKTFTWRGVPVSRSTYFRNQRRAEVKGSAGVEIEKPTSGLLPDVTLNDPAAQTEAPPMVLTEAEAALIGDFMVGTRSGRTIDNRYPVSIAPRLFQAMISALTKAGY